MILPDMTSGVLAIESLEPRRIVGVPRRPDSAHDARRRPRHESSDTETVLFRESTRKRRDLTCLPA
jgi:hypothetical protein